jgi:uncharacterized protein involved in propanediol utilization
MERGLRFTDQSRRGEGRALGHCGEFFQGALSLDERWGRADHEFHRWLPLMSKYLDEDIAPRSPPSMAVHCLVDVPCTAWVSKAQVVIRRSDQDAIESAGPHLSKSRRALALLLDLCEVHNVAAHVAIDSNIPPGKGCGSSSADVISTLRAGCGALGVVLPHQVMGILACMAERASNPVHLSRPVLFAHRRGLVVQDLGPVWPGFHALGFDPGGVVNTDQLEPLRYSQADLRRFMVAAETLQEAVRSGNAATLARISSDVARTDDRLAHDHGQIRRWLRDYGALGYAVSHSGVVGTLLWAKTNAGKARRDAAANALRSCARQVWTWAI